MQLISHDQSPLAFDLGLDVWKIKGQSPFRFYNITNI